ncbi:hypothetical protein AOLI_G00260450 [Acnodon oligacanthus]
MPRVSLSPPLLRASSEALVISLGRSILPAIQRCHFRLIYLASAYPRLSPALIHGVKQKGDGLKWKDQYNHQIALKPCKEDSCSMQVTPTCLFLLLLLSQACSSLCRASAEQ